MMVYRIQGFLCRIAATQSSDEPTNILYMVQTIPFKFKYLGTEWGIIYKFVHLCK